jgi:hypothetical protein
MTSAATKYPGTSGTARKASGAVLLGSASRCTACVPPINSRAVCGGSPSKARTLPTRRGPSIAARAPFARGYVAGLDKAGAAHGIKQCQAVDIGGAAVDRAHGAGGADGDQLGLLAGDFWVDRRNGISAVEIDQFPRADNVAGVIFLMRQRPGIAVDLQNIMAEAKGRAAVNDFKAGAVVHLIGEHFRSFLTTRADYSSGVICAYKAAHKTRQAVFCIAAVDGAGHGAKAACQDRKYARSGRAADAVRVHSLLLSRSRAEAASRPPRSPSFFLSMLTPARFDAMNLVRQFSAPDGVGWTVPAGTIQNRRQNHQPIEILRFCASVLRFSGIASRHVCVGVCVGVHAYMHAREARTSEPSILIVLIQGFSGSSAVLTWFSLEPHPVAGLESGGIASFPIKIVGRYCLEHASIGRKGFVAVEGGRKVWRFSTWLQRDRGRTWWACLNDGFLRVSAGRSGYVGTVRFERLAEARSNASFLALAHLPIRMAERSPRARQGHPPMPPLAGAIPSGSLALERARISIGYRAGSSRINLYGSLSCGGEVARRVSCATGPGEGWGSHLNPRSTGWGRKNAAGKLHRFRQAIGGLAHVN